MDIFNSIIEDFASSQIVRKQIEEERYLLDQGDFIQEPEYCHFCGDEIDPYDNGKFEFSGKVHLRKITGFVCGSCASDPENINCLNQYSNLKIKKNNDKSN